MNSCYGRGSNKQNKLLIVANIAGPVHNFWMDVCYFQNIS